MDARQIEILDELLDRDAGLNSWERRFIGDLDKKRGRHLTSNQVDKLEQIYEEKVP